MMPKLGMSSKVEKMYISTSTITPQMYNIGNMYTTELSKLHTVRHISDNFKTLGGQ